MKTLILTLAAVLVFGTLSYQYADARPFGGRGGFGPGCGGCANGPALSDQDLADREKFYEETEPIRRQLFELRQQYAETLDSDPVDKDKAEELWSQIFDLQTEIRTMAKEQGIVLGGPGYCLGPNGYYEGDGEKSSFRGNRGFGRQGGRWGNI
jgi:hypothetical protein